MQMGEAPVETVVEPQMLGGNNAPFPQAAVEELAGFDVAITFTGMVRWKKTKMAVS